MQSQTKTHTAKPFLRWAGGKRWLIKHLSKIITINHLNNYHEPFLGAGSVFLSLEINNKAFLSDLNPELISTYKTLKTNPRELIAELKKFKNTEEFYYHIRDKEFRSEIKQAARFIYLNQTSYNGIYRVNLLGKYNVPYGYRSKDFIEEDNLISVSKALRKVRFLSGDFELIKENLNKRDLVFLDPPYTVSHNLNGFIKYNQKLFSLQDQYRLSSLIDFIKSKGAFYILTNAAHKTILEIFEKGDKVIELSRANLIGGLQASREKTTELIFTNMK